MPSCPRNDERGFTLIDLLIASVITVVAIAAVGTVYFSLQTELERQRVVSDLDQTGRMAVNYLSERIRLSRSGADPAAALTAACACQISFTSNRRGVYTFLPTASAGPAVQVDSATGFALNDQVSLTDWSMWQNRTITAIGAGPPPTLTLSSALPSSFPRGSGVFQTFLTTLGLDLAQQRLVEGSQLLATAVRMDANGYPPSGEALFRYFNQSNTEIVPTGTGACTARCLTSNERSTVREVLIALTLESQRVTNQVTQQRSVVTHRTGVRIRLPSPP